MILAQLAHADRWNAVHPGLAAAFDFLRRTALESLPAGRRDIDGSRLYAMVVRTRGNGRAQSQLEAHRRYIDVHYQVSGTDVMGWKSTAACSAVARPYDANGDTALFSDPPDFFLCTRPGSFAVYFPDDAHAPLACEEEVHKVVVKVAVDWTES